MSNRENLLKSPKWFLLCQTDWLVITHLAANTFTSTVFTLPSRQSCTLIISVDPLSLNRYTPRLSDKEKDNKNKQYNKHKRESLRAWHVLKGSPSLSRTRWVLSTPRLFRRSGGVTLRQGYDANASTMLPKVSWTLIWKLWFHCLC